MSGPPDSVEIGSRWISPTGKHATVLNNHHIRRDGRVVISFVLNEYAGYATPESFLARFTRFDGPVGEPLKPTEQEHNFRLGGYEPFINHGDGTFTCRRHGCACRSRPS